MLSFLSNVFQSTFLHTTSQFHIDFNTRGQTKSLGKKANTPEGTGFNTINSFHRSWCNRQRHY